MVPSNVFHAKNRAAWRRWLEKNHDKKTDVWLLFHKKGNQAPCVKYEEAILEALCFGWIDSTARKRDDTSFVMYFASRKPRSVWSKINKGRIKKLIDQGLMTRAGLEKIEIAKANGSWTFLDSIEELVMPADLKKSLTRNKKALKYFEAFPGSVKKAIYSWIEHAKRAVTRQARIKETVMLAAKNQRANEWRPKQ